MASNFGLGAITPQGLAISDLKDVNVPRLNGRDHKKDFILKWKNDVKLFNLEPAAIQAHDHDTNLADLNDIDETIDDIKNKPHVPFSFAYSDRDNKFYTFELPRDFLELIEKPLTSVDPNIVGSVPYVLVYNSQTQIFSLSDMRHYLAEINHRVSRMNPRLHLKIDPMKTIVKENNILTRVFNSGSWYCSYIVNTGSVKLFYDTALKELGLKPDTEAKLELQTANQVMTNNLGAVNEGIMIIKCIKLSTESEYDPLFNGIEIICGQRTLLEIIINTKNNEVDVVSDTNNLPVRYKVSEGMTSLDIKTLTLKRLILIDLKLLDI